MDFEQEFLSWIAENYPEDKFRCLSIARTDEEYRGITPDKPNELCSILHLGDYESIYTVTGSFETAYSRMMSDFEKAKSHTSRIPEQVVHPDRNFILENVKFKMVDPALHPHITKILPYIKWSDLIAVPVISSRSHIDDNLYTLYLSNEIIEKNGLTKQEVLDVAMSHIKPKVETMDSVLFGIVEGGSSGEVTPDDIADMLRHTRTNMFVISSGNRDEFGASAVLDEDFLAKIAEGFNGDFIIIPSSVHELIAVPADFMPPNELRGIVAEVNNNSGMVSSTDLLSYNPHIYKRLEKTVSVFETETPENRRTQHV